MIAHITARQGSSRTGSFEGRKAVMWGSSLLGTLNSRFALQASDPDPHTRTLTNTLQDHVTYLRRTRVGAAVGTPGRLGKLLELGEFTAHFPTTTTEPIESDSLAVSALTHIIIDLSYRDAKRRSVLDIPDTRDEVFGKILSYKSVLQGIKAGRVQIVLF
jgi:hypothetical protein